VPDVVRNAHLANDGLGALTRDCLSQLGSPGEDPRLVFGQRVLQPVGPLLGALLKQRGLEILPNRAPVVPHVPERRPTLSVVHRLVHIGAALQEHAQLLHVTTILPQHMQRCLATAVTLVHLRPFGEQPLHGNGCGFGPEIRVRPVRGAGHCRHVVQRGVAVVSFGVDVGALLDEAQHVLKRTSLRRVGDVVSVVLLNR